MSAIDMVEASFFFLVFFSLDEDEDEDEDKGEEGKEEDREEEEDEEGPLSPLLLFGPLLLLFPLLEPPLELLDPFSSPRSPLIELRAFELIMSEAVLSFLFLFLSSSSASSPPTVDPFVLFETLRGSMAVFLRRIVLWTSSEEESEGSKVGEGGEEIFVRDDPKAEEEDDDDDEDDDEELRSEELPRSSPCESLEEREPGSGSGVSPL